MMPIIIRPILATELLPDLETNVLLCLSDGTTCEGFLDDDGDGTPLWRDVTAYPIEGARVTHWAAMPQREGGWA